MTYSYLTTPQYGEEPKSHSNRVLEIDRILARSGSAAVAAQHDQAAEAGLMALFQMELDPRA